MAIMLMAWTASASGALVTRRRLPHCPSWPYPHRPRPIIAPKHAQQQGTHGWTGVVKLGGPKIKKGNKKKTKDAAEVVEPAPAPAPAPASPSLPAPDPMWRLSVVQVLTTHQLPHPLKPWSQTADIQSSSSAVVVNAAQRLCITTAGAVHYAAWSPERDASLVQVYIPSYGCEVTAQVLVVAQDADLALIQLDTLPRSAVAQSPPATHADAPSSTSTSKHQQQPSAGLHAVSWARGTPELGSPVHVAGFAVAQSADTSAQTAGSVCVTKGVTSRLEVITYTYSGRRLLGLQVDAAVNTGCWGGGVFNSAGHCVGLLLQRSSNQAWKSAYCPSSHKSDAQRDEGTENVAYVVPVSVISHFLTDVKRHRGRYEGFPCLGFTWQPLLSPALRRYCDVPADVQGVLVTSCDPQQPSWHVLQPGDIVTHVGGHAVSATGHVHLPQQPQDQASGTSTGNGSAGLLAVCMSHVAASDQVGSELQVQVIRKGAPMTFKIRLSAPKPLVPMHASVSHDGVATGAAALPRAQHKDPAYVFLPPFAFVAATVPLMQQMYRSRAHMPQEPGRQRLGQRPPRANSSEAPAHTSHTQPKGGAVEAEIDDTDEPGYSLAVASNQGRMAACTSVRPTVTAAAGVPGPDTAIGSTTSRQSFKALQAAVYGLHAVDVAVTSTAALDLDELVLLVGSCPSWAKKPLTAKDNHLDPRTNDTDDEALLKHVQLPMWLISFNGVRVHSVAHLQELVDLHEGGAVRLGFACGSVLYIHLP